MGSPIKAGPRPQLPIPPEPSKFARAYAASEAKMSTAGTDQKDGGLGLVGTALGAYAIYSVVSAAFDSGGGSYSSSACDSSSSSSDSSSSSSDSSSSCSSGE